MLEVKWFELTPIEAEPIRGDKRQYMPWILRWRCEACGGENVHDFSEEYLSFPAFGTHNEVQLACTTCDQTDARGGEPSHTLIVIPRLVLEIADLTERDPPV